MCGQLDSDRGTGNIRSPTKMLAQNVLGQRSSKTHGTVKCTPAPLQKYCAVASNPTLSAKATCQCQLWTNKPPIHLACAHAWWQSRSTIWICGCHSQSLLSSCHEVIRAKDMVYSRKEVTDESRKTTREKETITWPAAFSAAFRHPHNTVFFKYRSCYIQAFYPHFYNLVQDHLVAGLIH